MEKIPVNPNKSNHGQAYCVIRFSVNCIPETAILGFSFDYDSCVAFANAVALVEYESIIDTDGNDGIAYSEYQEQCSTCKSSVCDELDDHADSHYWPRDKVNYARIAAVTDGDYTLHITEIRHI